MNTRLILIIIFCTSTLSYAQEQSRDTIIVGVKNTPPFIIEQPDGTYTGISITLWESIANNMNVPYKYEKYTLENLQKRLENNQLDLSINPLTVTSERVQKYDFTQPFFITNLAIATTKSGQNKWITFLRNFFSVEFFKAITLLFIILLIFGLLVWIFERKKNKDQFGSGWSGVWAGLWWSAVTMTTVGYGDKAPTTTGGRIVALIWMFTAIIIISGFTASIASALTVTELQTQIKGPQDLQKVSVATVAASTGEKYLQRGNITYEPTTNLEEALKMLDEGTVNAVVYDEPLLRYTIENNNYENELMVLEHTFATQYYSFALSEDNEILQEVDVALLREINSAGWSVILERYGLSDN